MDDGGKSSWATGPADSEDSEEDDHKQRLIRVIARAGRQEDRHGEDDDDDDDSKLTQAGRVWLSEDARAGDQHEWAPAGGGAVGRKHVDPTHIDWGFDLTSFGEEKDGVACFQRLLDLLGLSHTPQPMRFPPAWARVSSASKKHSLMNGTPFVWSSKDMTVLTHNNPISGTYASTLEPTHVPAGSTTTNMCGQLGNKMRHDELGYASYVGLHGTLVLVHKAVEFIKTHAASVKGESKGSRAFV
jgi:hypothetical protein